MGATGLPDRPLRVNNRGPFIKYALHDPVETKVHSQDTMVCRLGHYFTALKLAISVDKEP